MESVSWRGLNIFIIILLHAHFSLIIIFKRYTLFNNRTKMLCEKRNTLLAIENKLYGKTPKSVISFSLTVLRSILYQYFCSF